MSESAALVTYAVTEEQIAETKARYAALDFSHEFVLIRKARTANLSAPAEEEGRDE